MTAVLYAIPASHPCAAVERALQLKGVPYRRVELIPVVHRLPQRLRFGAGSVPGVTFDDGARVIGSRAILRALEERVAQPPLLPADGELARASSARRSGATRCCSRSCGACSGRRCGARRRRSRATPRARSCPFPRPVARRAPRWSRAWRSGSTARRDPDVRADLIALPGHLDRVDRWIADGTLGGERANAADLQIGAGLRLLLTVEDVRAAARRPARRPRWRAAGSRPTRARCRRGRCRARAWLAPRRDLAPPPVLAGAATARSAARSRRASAPARRARRRTASCASARARAAARRGRASQRHARAPDVPGAERDGRQRRARTGAAPCAQRGRRASTTPEQRPTVPSDARQPHAHPPAPVDRRSAA